MATTRTAGITIGTDGRFFIDNATAACGHRPRQTQPGDSTKPVHLLLPHTGHLEPHQVHDATLVPFIAHRLAAGASATTVNRSLEVVAGTRAWRLCGVSRNRKQRIWRT
jgi:hypothetical protein